MNRLIELAERRRMPDGLVRFGIRRLLKVRLREAGDRTNGGPSGNVAAFAERMQNSPIAVAQDQANTQHYELPAEFFESVLGPALKYSSGLWSESDDLRSAEERMLRVTCERAGITDGMAILDVGCGWGSLSLWIARHKPRCTVVAVSNSERQGEYIRHRCHREGLRNLEVVTSDIAEFQTDRKFDRVVSVEMFEHMRNWHLLFRRIASWLTADGAFFLHVFTHRRLAYFYEDRGSSDWMARHFFTGGVMPSEDLPFHFSTDLRVVRHWRVDGTHYSRTLEAWLQAMDSGKDRVMPILHSVYGDDADRAFARWRLFFMACSELFKFNRGNEWGVTHYLLEPSQGVSAAGRARHATRLPLGSRDSAGAEAAHSESRGG